MDEKLEKRIEAWKDDPEGMKSWLENPYWLGYYEEAPTEICKTLVALEFYYSDTEDEEASELMDQMEGKLGLEDLKHLLKYCGQNPRRAKIAAAIAELEKNL